MQARRMRGHHRRQAQALAEQHVADLLGLAALLHTSAVAFETLKYAGVAYLLFLAWKMWHAPATVAGEEMPDADTGPGARAGDARGGPTHLHFGISPPCPDKEWSVRRGVVWPYPYLDAWKAGTQLSPVDEVTRWATAHRWTGHDDPDDDRRPVAAIREGLDELARLAAAYGVATEYWDQGGTLVQVGEATVAAVLTAPAADLVAYDMETERHWRALTGPALRQP